MATGAKICELSKRRLRESGHLARGIIAADTAASLAFVE